MCCNIKITHFASAMKAYKGSRAIARLIRNVGSRWWSTSRPGRFNPGKELRYPMNRRLGGAQSRSGRVGEEENLGPSSQ